jgi:hypothetical protein
MGSGQETYMWASITNTTLLWGGLLGAAIGSVFVYYGVGNKPAYFWGSNKIMPMGARRFVYLPVGVLFLIFALRDIFNGVR